MVTLFFFFFFFAFMCFSNQEGVYCLVVDWELTGRMGVDLSFPLVLDYVSCVFVSVVLYISGCVSLFSGFYMSHEKFYSRFLLVLMFFVFFMVLLVLFPGFLALMVGWDGLGVTSFLLVVYYMDWDCLSAGMITALSNRIGDMFFVLAVSVLSLSLGFLSFDVDFVKVFYSEKVVLVLGFILVLGSMTKSAVMPFSAWLPEAMAAPTPVSSLVHSSTLVTGGVYVLVRFGDLVSEFCNCFLMFFSLLTIFMAGSVAVSLVDLKKVVALSTLSQVSTMMLSISVGAVDVAFFHLVVHAFFKALLFLCVGSVIFYSGGIQDVRFLNSLWLKMPLVFSLLIVSVLCLTGFPFLSGYYSKDLIIMSLLSGYSSLFTFVLVYLSLVFTFDYSVRMVWLLCTSQSVVPLNSFKSNNFCLNSSLLLMGFGSVVSSVVFQSFMMKMNYFTYMSVLILYSGSFWAGMWSMNMLLLGSVMKKSMVIPFGGVPFKGFMSLLWYMTPLSGGVLSSLFLRGFSILTSLLDMGWIRGYIWKNGLKALFNSGTNSVRFLSFVPLGFLLFYGVFLLALVFL